MVKTDLVASAGLFVGSIILCKKWLSNNNDDDYGSDSDYEDEGGPGSACGHNNDNVNDDVDAALLESYYVRRAQERLSFHGEGTHTIECELLDDPRSGEDVRGEVDSTADFYPIKRSNWSHFDLPESMRSGNNHKHQPEYDVTVHPPFQQRSLEGDYNSEHGSHQSLKKLGTVQSYSSIINQMNQSDEDGGCALPLPSIPSGSPANPGNAAAVISDQSALPFPPKKLPSSRLYRRAESLDDRTVFSHRGEGLPDPKNNISTTANSSSNLDKTTDPPKIPRSPLTKRSLSDPFLLHSEEEDGQINAGIRGYDRSLSGQVRRQNLAARAHYNARIMPNKLVLVRHGQSAGNIDERLYSKIPDNSMPLTHLGWEQARAAGRHLKDNVLKKNPESVHFIISPYVRSMETFHGIASAWCDPAEFRHIPDLDQRTKAWYGRLRELGLSWHEDPRIREQDFGNYQDPATIKQSKKDRHGFGAFYYRFPHGESASDVYDRISTFLDSLWRSFDMTNGKNYILVTHGISIRVLLTRYFRYTIDQFHLLANPRNCDQIVLTHDGLGRLEMSGRYELVVEEDEEKHEKHVVGCHFHKRLRVLPPHHIRKARVRLSYDD